MPHAVSQHLDKVPPGTRATLVGWGYKGFDSTTQLNGINVTVVPCTDLQGKPLYADGSQMDRLICTEKTDGGEGGACYGGTGGAWRIVSTIIIFKNRKIFKNSFHESID